MASPQVSPAPAEGDGYGNVSQRPSQNGRDLSAALGSVGEDEAADNAEVPIPQGSPQPDIEMTISKSKTVGDLPSNSSTQFAPRKSGIGSMTAMIRQGSQSLHRKSTASFRTGPGGGAVLGADGSPLKSPNRGTLIGGTLNIASGGMKLAGGLAQGTVMMGAKGTLDLTKGAMNAGLGVGDVLTGGAMGNVAAQWKKVTRGKSAHETSKRSVGSRRLNQEMNSMEQALAEDQANDVISAGKRGYTPIELQYNRIKTNTKRSAFIMLGSFFCCWLTNELQTNTWYTISVSERCCAKMYDYRLVLAIAVVLDVVALAFALCVRRVAVRGVTVGLALVVLAGLVSTLDSQYESEGMICGNNECEEGLELFSVIRATVNDQYTLLELGESEIKPVHLLTTVKTINMFGFNIAQIILNFLYHYHMLRLDMMLKEQKVENWISISLKLVQIPGKRFTIFWQTIAILFCPFPGWNPWEVAKTGLDESDPWVVYNIDSFNFFLVIGLRLFLMVRIFLVFQKLFTAEASTISKITGTAISSTMPIRVYLAKTPAEVLYIMPTIYIMSIAYIHYSLEYSTNYWPVDRTCTDTDGYTDSYMRRGRTVHAPTNTCELIIQSEHPITIINSAWLHFVTMTTIGYGEYQVQTHIGRLLIVISWVFGLIVDSFVLSGFIQSINVTRSEKFLLDKLEHKHLTKMKHNDAASLITHFIKYWCIYTKYQNTMLKPRDKAILERYYETNGTSKRRKMSMMAGAAGKGVKVKDEILHVTSIKKREQVDISDMSDEEVIKAGRELKKKLNGPSWWRMKMREMLAKRPYDLAMFRFKTTLHAIENFKQKEFNIESMVEQTLRHTVCVEDINRRAGRTERECSQIKGMLIDIGVAFKHQQEDSLAGNAPTTPTGSDTESDDGYHGGRRRHKSIMETAGPVMESDSGSESEGASDTETDMDDSNPSRFDGDFTPEGETPHSTSARLRTVKSGVADGDESDSESAAGGPPPPPGSKAEA
mmetsp:Transcript_66376/g.183310  ORF Transcript_66376/g.183310 Transcript_66376/m.183310 type:complete len:994 (+) Transcript_66376:369-3350(+)